MTILKVKVRIYISGTSSLTVLRCELQHCFLTKKAELKREKKGEGVVFHRCTNILVLTATFIVRKQKMNI